MPSWVKTHHQASRPLVGGLGSRGSKEERENSLRTSLRLPCRPLRPYPVGSQPRDGVGGDNSNKRLALVSGRGRRENSRTTVLARVGQARTRRVAGVKARVARSGLGKVRAKVKRRKLRGLPLLRPPWANPITSSIPIPLANPKRRPLMSTLPTDGRLGSESGPSMRIARPRRALSSPKKTKPRNHASPSLSGEWKPCFDGGTRPSNR